MDVIETLRRALQDRYAVERELGQGGMATVYLAEDLKHHRKVALKVLRPEVSAALGAERFLREIETTAQLTHPHILPIHDSGEADGTLFYVMPYVEGESLRDRLTREKQLPLDDALQIAREVADALSYAHSRGVIHRDIKPENILLESGHAVVADFGIARAVSAAGGERLTETGLAVGTPAYMSPEQAAGNPDFDGRSDLYSLGCVLYEMLIGEAPYTGPTPQAILARKLSEPLPRISVVRETVPAGVEALIARALARVPADRWPTAAEFGAALAHPETVSVTGVQAYGRTGVRRVAGTRWQRVAAVAAGVAVVAAAGAALGRFLLHRPLNITVSDITPVTSDPGVEFQPAISPDGQAVAYVAGPIDRPRLHLRSTANVAGEAAIRLGDTVPGSDWLPAWTPDGQSIQFLDCGPRGFDLVLGETRCVKKEVGKLGGAVRTVAGPQSRRWALSPDGARVAFVRRDTMFVSPVTDTLNPRQLSVEGDPHSLTWSPDGRRIALVIGNSQARAIHNIDLSAVFVVDADGREFCQAAWDSAINVSPVWLDARHLLYVSNRHGPRAVYVVEVGARAVLGTPRAVPGIADPYSISYSIASRKLAWARFTARQNIWAYPLDRPGPVSIRDGRPVTTGAQLIESHDVSPDGRWIVFDGGARGSGLRGSMDLYKIPAAGGDIVPLAHFRFEAFNPRWSPDGRQIAFQGGDVDGISVLPAEGGTPTVLTEATGMNVEPAWSPDGLAVSFYSTRASVRGGGQTWVVTRDSVGGTWHEARLLADSARGVSDWAPDGSGGIVPGRRVSWHSTWDFVSPQGRRLWRRDVAARYGLTLMSGRARYSRDGRTVYAAGEDRNGRRGIWAIPVAGSTPRLVVAFDDPALANPLGNLSVGPDRLYLTVAQYESDIWVAKLNY